MDLGVRKPGVKPVMELLRSREETQYDSIKRTLANGWTRLSLSCVMHFYVDLVKPLVLWVLVSLFIKLRT